MAFPGMPPRGFTLLELLVVLAICAMALSVAVPALTKSAATDLKANARTLAAGLRSARENAIAGNREVTLILDLDLLEMALSAPESVRQSPSRKLSNSIHYKLFTAESEWLSESRGGIRFFPDGSSTGGRITLSLARAAVVVDVDWLTGRIQLLEGTEQDVTNASGIVAGGA